MQLGAVHLLPQAPRYLRPLCFCFLLAVDRRAVGEQGNNP